MNYDDIYGYEPESDDEVCPYCGCKVNSIKFSDDAWGNTKTFTEKTCSNDDCGWERVE